ncbi:MAG: 50S ribosomal protein L13 [Planctomycetes bacterium]|jgi:large subunit ribosomal protein L13|nr:50S ribosomal protein L13 [Planctomycetota bacterium]
MNRQTYHAKNDEVAPQWHHVDATGQVLGRLASRLAVILMGKHKPTYTPHQDVGDFIVVTNAEKIVVTGSKLDQRVHETFSGHPSGRKTKTLRQVKAERPERLIEESVRRMLPKSKLGRQMFTKLKVYAGEEHPHSAQQPQPLEVCA